jgi:DNA-binding transcriptional MerR regulator
MDGLLKMSELAELSGVSPGAIKHYLREGLLGEDGDVVRTSRNMAYYPREFVDRVKLIKRLQGDRFLPLKVIKGMLDADPSRAQALLDLEDRILDRTLAKADDRRVSAAEVRRRYELPQKMLDRLAELGVLTPTPNGYDADDVRIIDTMARFRAGGYDERLGFTVYETLRYKEALEPLVQQEVRTLLDRFAGQDIDPERAAEIIASGSEPLRELVGALHSKLLLAELRRQRGRG